MKYRTKVYSFSFLIILMTGMTGTVLGQKDYLFENISVNEGLSNNEAFYPYQDSYGFMWISTLDGLNRYDGYDIKVFKNDPSDSTSIASDIVAAMIEDNEGYLWISCFGNVVARYDPKNDTFKNFPIDRQGIGNVSDFFGALKDTKGNIWFTTTNHGVQKYEKTKGRFEHIGLDSTNTPTRWGEMYEIIELKNGNIITTDYSNGIKIYNEKLNMFQPYYIKANYSPNEIARIYEDKSGNIWFGGNSKLIKYSPTYYTTEEFDIFSSSPNPTNYDVVMGIVEDNENNLWVGVYSQGLFRLDYKSGEVRKYILGDIIRDGSGRDVILRMYKDRYGIIWIGTLGSGLIKFDPLREPFKFYKLFTEDHSGAGSNIVTSIAGMQHKSNIIIGTRNEGLYQFDLNNKRSKKMDLRLPSDPANGDAVDIRCMIADRDDVIWFAYNNRGLNTIDKSGRVLPIDSPHQGKTAGYVVNMMTSDLMDNVWMASRYGIERYQARTNSFSLLPTIMNKPFDKELRKNIKQILESRNPISKIMKVGEAANLEEKFTLESDQQVMIVCLGEGRMIQGNRGIFDFGAIRDNTGGIIWTMDDLSRTFNDGGGFKNRIAIECLELKAGEYRLNYISDVGHSYGNWNVAAPPDSDWWGIQVLPLSASEFESIHVLNEQKIAQLGYMPMEVGRFIEISKRYHNVVWIGSTQNGFFQYDLSDGSFKQYNYDPRNQFAANNYISYILEDREGYVWVATANKLLQFDPEHETFQKFDQSDGLASNVINALIEDLEGNLWISTSGGLSKLNKYAPQDKWNFVNFDTRDGLIGYSSSPACWRNSDGELIIGGNDGINTFYPGRINPTRPDIVIHDLKISDISLKTDSAGVQLEKSILAMEELNLPYSLNDLSFDFATIHFSRPEKNKMSYRA